jgi:hypothetical protein
LALALCWCVAQPLAPASAAGTCRSRSGNYFDGYYQNGRPDWTFTGASSYIVVRDGARCAGDTGTRNFSNAWVMIAGSGDRDWGQVGFERSALSSVSRSNLRWFSQFSSADGLATKYSPSSVAAEVGIRHTFRVLYDASCRCLRANIDGSVGWYSSPFDPKADWGPQPWSPQFMAETGYLEADVPGRPGTPTSFSGLGAQRLDNGRLVSMPCILTGANDNPTRWGRSASSCTAFGVWTK